MKQNIPKVSEPLGRQPDWVVGSIVVTVEEFKNWLINEGDAYFSEYQGKAQIKLQLRNGNKGMYLAVDTYKPNQASEQSQASQEDPLPVFNIENDAVKGKLPF